MNNNQIKALLKQGETGRHSIGNGLYFRISKEGTGFWVVRYTIHEKRREIAIGSYPDISLADANLETALIKKGVKNGIDPLAERQRVEQVEFKTIDDLAEDWLKDCDKRLKHSHIPRRVYRKDIAPFVGGLTFKQVSPRDIRAIITKITNSGRPTISNDALMYCKQLFRHGVKLDLLTHNPAEAFNVNDAGGVEQSRSRSLSLKELNIFFRTLRAFPDQFTRENYLAVALLLALAV